MSAIVKACDRAQKQREEEEEEEEEEELFRK